MNPKTLQTSHHRSKWKWRPTAQILTEAHIKKPKSRPKPPLGNRYPHN